MERAGVGRFQDFLLDLELPVAVPGESGLLFLDPPTGQGRVHLVLQQLAGQGASAGLVRLAAQRVDEHQRDRGQRRRHDKDARQ